MQEQLFTHHGSYHIHAAGARTNNGAQGLARSRGPAVQRVYPSDNSVVEYWLAPTLTSCTVDGGAGCKYVKVVSAAVYDEEDFSGGRRDARVGLALDV